MISITQDLSLQSITVNDVTLLQTLMQNIYPAAYQHFWKDGGDFYVDKQYSEENILKELSQENSPYYFIVYKGEIIGNFRFVWDENLLGLSEEKQVKLHRIYLHPKDQNKGLGKHLLTWLEGLAIKKNVTVIWLDAMDSQKQAFEFYRKRGYNYYGHKVLDFELMHASFRKMSQIYKLLY
ncbi:GNAT family N-acetyltransferase [Polaribacter sp. HL-MS24]|uniref:GNAT family N-acetyltransferase n=1 Tax=Polaribacter sp. HL-MS24 TaxID=3077735 RepID=UPI0029350CED|nr:GNAT family N-acetyltransferase [Polaribacter sp. HL-MS24]WOC41174.1 GNAT family N-acetyltransferase [Polaribacter sp. HL-MS24]